jgi:hypothetical protein
VRRGDEDDRSTPAAAADTAHESAATPTSSRPAFCFLSNARESTSRGVDPVWCEPEWPWEVESEVIARMQPPLNSAGNRDHPFYSVVSSARAALRAAARP